MTITDKRESDANYKLLEAARPYIQSATNLVVHLALAGRGDDVLAGLRDIMAQVEAEEEGKREPTEGEGSPANVRRSQDYMDGRRDYLRAQSATAYRAMVERMGGAWQDAPGVTVVEVVAPPTDATVTDATDDPYADYCERLSNQWQEGA